MSINSLQAGLSSAAQEITSAPQATAVPSGSMSVADVMALISQERQASEDRLRKEREAADARIEKLLAAQQSPAAPAKGKGKKAKEEKVAPVIPAALAGFQWTEGVSSKGKTYRQCGFPGSDWTIRYYVESKSLCLCKGRNFIYADGVTALDALSTAWPQALAAIAGSNGEE